MPEIVEFPAGANDVEVLIAVRDPGDAVVAVGVGDWLRRKAGVSLDGVFAMVGALARSYARGLADAPVEQAELELGLEFSGGLAYVVDAKANATLRAKITIRRSPTETTTSD